MIVAFYHHPAPGAPMEYDYDAMAKRLIHNCDALGYLPFHLCCKGGPQYDCSRFQVDANPEQIMLSRMKAYCAFAEEVSAAWYVDTDTIIQKPLPDTASDVVLTWRPHKILGSHYNGGVIYTKGPELWRRCLPAYPKEGDVWGGDQYAITNWRGRS